MVKNGDLSGSWAAFIESQRSGPGDKPEIRARSRKTSWKLGKPRSQASKQNREAPRGQRTFHESKPEIKAKEEKQPRDQAHRKNWSQESKQQPKQRRKSEVSTRQDLGTKNEKQTGVWKCIPGVRTRNQNRHWREMRVKEDLFLSKGTTQRVHLSIPSCPDGSKITNLGKQGQP